MADRRGKCNDDEPRRHRGTEITNYFASVFSVSPWFEYEASC